MTARGTNMTPLTGHGAERCPCSEGAWLRLLLLSGTLSGRCPLPMPTILYALLTAGSGYGTGLHQRPCVRGCWRSRRWVPVAVVVVRACCVSGEV